MIGSRLNLDSGPKHSQLLNKFYVRGCFGKIEKTERVGVGGVNCKTQNFSSELNLFLDQPELKSTSDLYPQGPHGTGGTHFP